ncbi:ABC transporter substrate-binding protein [Telmatospirillum sp.]|uniref:ABC transporter substrate-binding protein n=1 Tax=Telmatospirillum sp. TaxID=2079197 RepID=UPI002848A3C7|nr:ABC transporter substrate-binding protein [Telmatospirillum sp.]MDR3440202.1 ABC transporter substrate-binding protein [Telmatospirillum sp.]
MRSLVTTLAGLLLAGALFRPALAVEPVKIGEINSYVAIPAFTVPYRNGWQLAVDEINKAGGVLNGRPLEIVSRDDSGRLAQSLSIAEDLVAHDGVPVIMGSFLSHIGLGLSEFAQRKKIVFLAVEPLTDDLVWSKGNRYTFRLRASSYMQASMLAERAATLPAKRWATVAPNYEFGRSIVGNFETLLKARRPDVSFVAEQWPTLGNLDPAVVVPAIEQKRPDAIFNATFGSDLGRLIHEGNAQGLFKKRAVVSVLTGEPEVLDVLADEAPEGWIVTGYPWYDIKAADHQTFVDAYMAAYNEDPRLAALLGYAAVKALAAAIEQAGGTNPEKLIAAFEHLTFSSPIGPISFRAADHQATMGTWVGTTALRDGAGVMINWVYDDGQKYLPDMDLARKKRPADVEGSH